MKRKEKEVKKKNIYTCPHCGEAINPASMLWAAGRKKRDESPERMRQVVMARWNRVKLYGR